MLRDPYIDVDMVNGTTYTARDIYQYDHGLKVRLTNLTGSAAATAQFSIEGASRSVNVAFSLSGNLQSADVPDYLLMQDREIRCYVYVESASSGITVKEVRIPIIPRARPNTSEYTPEQIENYNKLLGDLRELLEETGDAQSIILEGREVAKYLLDIQMEVDETDGCLYLDMKDE